jgi:O-antigen/teichoic acid export membrane protein
MTRRQIALWNAAFGYTTLGVTLARNILLVPLYLRYIPLGEYGAWLATGGALVTLLIADFGMSGVVMQRVAACAGNGDLTRLRATIVAGLVNAVLLALGLTLLSSLLAPFLPGTQGLDAATVSRVVACFLIAVAANGFGIVALAAAAAVRGLQKPVAAGSVTLIADLLSIVATVMCLVGGLGLYSLALGMLLRSAASSAGGLIVLYFVGRHGATPGKFAWTDSMTLWRDAGKFFVTSIAMRLQLQTNTVVIGAVLGPTTAAVYALTVRAHETVNVVLLQLNAALCPVLAHLAGAGQQVRLDGVIRTLVPLVAAIAAVGLTGVVVFNESFVRLWVGEQTFGGFAVTILMAVALWIGALASVGYEALLARGEFATIARSYAVSSTIHIVLLVSLVNLGAWGASLALCVSGLVLASGVWRRVLRDMGVGRDEWARMALDPLVIGAIAATVGVASFVLLPRATTWSTLIGEAVLVAAALGALLLILRPSLRRLVRTELVSTLRAVRPA